MTEEFELTAAEIYTLNKASLAEALVDHVAGLDRPHAKLIVETFFELVAEHLTGETVTITERRVVTFHPSGTLNSRVTTNLIAGGED